MDLNYLFFRHQVATMMAGLAAGSEARHAHRAMAASYAERIRQLQRAGGLATPFAPA